MDVSEAREMCKDRTMWKSTVSAYLLGNRHFKLSKDILPSGNLDCTTCTQETKQMTGAVHAGAPRAAAGAALGARLI
ncbi:hypothetical protein EVAR_4743_1 [Eumeta japonica]|uniref:Uncharacterized protein n=1 Tax=Eumeta variegata TaxID=151549 RepID=A0A4C1SZJ0_EUMVA|nr:hypothetical protein EVAR_4743_1 [Eumeta japonica]